MASSPNPKMLKKKQKEEVHGKAKAKPTSAARSSKMRTMTMSKRTCKKKLDEEDTLTILNALVKYKAENGGRNPTPHSAQPWFVALQASIHSRLKHKQIKRKVRTFKERYQKAVGGPTTPFEHSFFDLCFKAFGEKKQPLPPNAKGKGVAVDEGLELIGDDDGDDDEHNDDDNMEEEENDDVGPFKLVIEEARRFWALMGFPISDLVLGLKYMDKAKAAALEEELKDYKEIGVELEAEAREVIEDVIARLMS